MEDLAFDGTAPLARWWPRHEPGRTDTPEPDGRADTRPAPGGDGLPDDLTELAVTAHSAVLHTHAALQNLLVDHASRGTRPYRARPGAPEGGGSAVAAVHAAGESTGTMADEATGQVTASLVWRGSPPQRAEGLRTRRDRTAAGSGWSVLLDGHLLAEARQDVPGTQGQETAAPRRSAAIRQPLWRPARHDLARGDLDTLASGGVGHVFGGGAAGRSLPAGAFDAVGFDLLDEVGLSGAAVATGAVPSAPPGSRSWCEIVRAGWQLLLARALHDGLHLCLPGAWARPAADAPVTVRLRDTGRLGNRLVLRAALTASGLVPRPYVTADIDVADADGPLGRLDGVSVSLQEAAGASVTPGSNGSGRRSSRGEPVYANELHMAHAAEGDLSVTYGPAARTSAAAVRPRLPRGDLLMLDRLVTAPGTASASEPAYVTEYDVPPDPWYVRQNAGVFPWFARLEIALQAAGFVGASLGSSLEYPRENLTVRNLEGHAELLNPMPLGGRTVRQHTTLLSHTPLPGALLQRSSFELSVAGEVFQRGGTVHGFFTEAALARQQGLDGGRHLPPWILAQPEASAAADRFRPAGPAASPDHRLGFLGGADCLSLPNGGRHRRGYLLATREISEEDWFFGRHFLDDPVMPGSCGVELLFQALRVHLARSAVLSPDAAHALVPACGHPLKWTYRGQILPHHQQLQAEIQISELHEHRGKLLAVADGSVWRDGLRIYEVEGIALTTPDDAPDRRTR
ncbi:3-hydroxyacyl-ACP dehydratase [Streptomyces qinglanensis]|uniref:3-hydroxyacyl-ACP dehydratase n=1 Tax=Streptomyces qinglanensis TaxID=943816 RepID=UPI003D712F8E